MQIYLKSEKKIYAYHPNSVRTDCDLDITFGCEEEKSIDVIMGENGVGKSFLYQNFVYIAYLYQKHQNSNELQDDFANIINRNRYNNDVNSNDLQDDFADIHAVVSRLYDSGIGWIRFNEKKDLPQDSFHITIKTSYHPQDKSRVEKEEETPSCDDEDVKEAVNQINGYKSRFARYFSIVISDRAKAFLDDYKVIFYSNTQFPSNLYLFSDKVSSFLPFDENYFILDCVRNIKYNCKMKLSYWMNFSGINLFPQIKITNDFLENGKFERCLKKLNKIYKGYLRNVKKESLLESTLLNKILEKQVCAQKNGYEYYFITEEIELNEKTEKDVLLLFFLSELCGNVGFELQCELAEGFFVPFKLLNSGEKYDLTLEKLQKYCDKKTVLIIDEPENSLHVCKQEEKALFDEMSSKLCLISHSPAFISGLVRRISGKTFLYLMEKNSENEIEIECMENSAVDSLSLDSISAEYLGYSPYLQKWLNVNKSWLDNNELVEKNMISVDEFYRRLGEAK